MTLPIASSALAVAGLFGTWLISRKHLIGWLYLVAFQFPAGAYDIWTRQYGFVLTTIIGAHIYWQGWRLRCGPIERTKQ